MLDFLEQGFITVLNMSITGSYITTAIILIRLLLKKAPKIFSYCLWAVAGLRLLCPFSFSSVLSIFNLFSAPQQSSAGSATSYSYVPQNIATMQIPEIETGISAADTLINPVLPTAQITASVNPMQIITAASSVIWIIGIAAMAAYGIISLVKIKNQVRFATKLEGNIFECDKIRSPFVLGFFSPKIYLPFGMTETQKEYVILHEKNHIRRFDHITKLISFAVLMLHWFNPLVWVGYNLMVHDMEMSCDESVLRKLGADAKKAYSFTLVNIGANQKLAFGAPLSFGENGVKKRVVNILNFKKPKVIAIIACALVCVIAGAVCLTNAVYKKDVYDELQTKIEDFIEIKYAETPGADSYTLGVAGVKVTDVSKDGTKVNGYYKVFDFDIHYSELLRYEDYLSPTEIPATVPFIATLDENGEITDFERIEIGNASVQYNLDVRERAYQRAEKQLKALYSKVRVYTKGIFGSGFSGTNLDMLEASSFELVSDCFGKPVAVISFKCLDSEKDYRISDYFELEKVENGNKVSLEAKTLSSNDSIKVPSGRNAEKEVLYFAELSKYIDNVEESKYIITLFVLSDGGEAYEELKIDFEVDALSPSPFTKPSLTYDSLNPGYNPPLFNAGRTASDFTNGTMYINYAPQNVIDLTEDNLKQIQKLLKNSVWTPDFENRINGMDGQFAYTFNLTDENGRNYSFYVHGKNAFDNNADSSGNQNIEFNSAELFEAAQSIYQASEFYVPPSPEQNTTDIHDYVEWSMSVAQGIEHNNLNTTAPQGNPQSEKTLRYLTSDVVFTPPVPELTLWSLEVTDRFITVYLANNGTQRVNFDEGYSIDKQIDGNWQTVEQIREHNVTETKFIGQNEYDWLQLPVEKFFVNIENGRYRVHIPAYTNTKTEITIEFTVTKYITTRVYGAQKITGTPIAVSIKPQDNSNFNFNQYSAEEIVKIAELYNHLELNELPRGDRAVNQLSVSIIDDEGYEYYFEIEPDGSVNWNYYTEEGAELYKLLMLESQLRADF